MYLHVQEGSEVKPCDSTGGAYSTEKGIEVNHKAPGFNVFCDLFACAKQNTEVTMEANETKSMSRFM